MKHPRAISVSHIVAAALAVSLMTGSIAAEARDHDRGRHSRHDERSGHNRHDRHVRNDHDRHRVDGRDDGRADGRDERRAYERGYSQARFEAGRYERPAGYRYYTWRPGARLPVAYYAPRYVVHDYGHYRLHRPPHGHHWVRVDHDVVLAAIATGAVIAVVNDLFH